MKKISRWEPKIEKNTDFTDKKYKMLTETNNDVTMYPMREISFLENRQDINIYILTQSINTTRIYVTWTRQEFMSTSLTKKTHTTKRQEITNVQEKKQWQKSAIKKQ